MITRIGFFFTLDDAGGPDRTDVPGICNLRSKSGSPAFVVTPSAPPHHPLAQQIEQGIGAELDAQHVEETSARLPAKGHGDRVHDRRQAVRASG